MELGFEKYTGHVTLLIEFVELINFELDLLSPQLPSMATSSTPSLFCELLWCSVSNLTLIRPEEMYVNNSRAIKGLKKLR
jgi:hypothetical protein